jgi:hypothetical protein
MEALAKLRVELAPNGGGAGPPAVLPRPRPRSLLGEEEEALVREIGGSLAELAAATASAHPATVALPESVTLGSIGGAEWVMRSALQSEEPERLRELVPDFVYLVTLPYLEREGARAAAARSRELIEADGDGG